MNPFTPSDSPANKWKSERNRMIIVLVVLVGPYLLTYYFRDTVMEWLGFHRGGLGEDMLWLYITRDFAKGVCALGAMVFALGAAGVARRWWPDAAAMMVWLPLIWYGGPIAQSWIIFQSCPGLLEGQRSSSSWPTLDSYVHDAGIERAHTLVLTCTLGLVVILTGAELLRRRQQSRKAA